MRKEVIAALAVGSLTLLGLGQRANQVHPYASANPMRTPTIFGQGVISTGDFESHPAFTPDGRTLYFVKSTPSFSFWTIVVSRFVDGQWTTPEVAPFSGRYSDADPFITVDGKHLYFISRRPGPGKSTPDLDIWAMDKTESGWSEPRNLGAPVKSAGNEWYPTVAADGTLYFGSDRPGGKGATDVYRSRLVNGQYQAPENLGDAVNTEFDEYEPYIAPDQSYLIFMAAGRPDGHSRSNDLYISFQNDGAWTKARNLGDEINSHRDEYSPKVSPDGKYFFFTSARGRRPPEKQMNYADLLAWLRGPGNGLGDIYQVDLSTIGVPGGVVSRPAASAPQASTPATSAERRYKNIQVLQGLPASQLLSMMHIMRASLGVHCDHCHVTENEQYERDDKKPKQVARRMIAMVLEMNKAHFDGRQLVTCNSCHRGQVEPVAVVPIGQGLFPDTTRSPSTVQTSLPTVSQVLERYVKALGGREALETTITRTASGVFYRMRVDNPGTASARAVNRGEAIPMEIVLEAPNKFSLQLSSAQESIRQAYDGADGWLITPEGRRALTSVEIARIAAENDIHAPLKLAERVTALSVAAMDQIDGRSAFRLEGVAADGRREQLWFDLETDLLRRRILLTATPVGPSSEQIDYEDYRDVSGVKVSFRVKTSFIDDNHLGTTKVFNVVKHNVKLAPGSFEAGPPTRP